MNLNSNTTYKERSEDPKSKEHHLEKIVSKMSGDNTFSSPFSKQWVTNKKLPTPEEFLRLFCKTSKPMMVSKLNSFSKIEKHGQLFRSIDYMLSNEPIIDAYESYLIYVKIQMPLHHQVTVSLNSTKIASICSYSLKLEKYYRNFIKVPYKRKATMEIFNRFFYKKQKINEIIPQLCIHFCRQQNFFSKDLEIVEYIQDIPYVNEILRYSDCSKIFMYRSSFRITKIQYQTKISLNTYLKKPCYSNKCIRAEDLQSERKERKPFANLGLSEIERENIFPNLIIRKCYNTELSIWDTRAVIKLINSIHKRMFNSFTKLSFSLKNNFDTFIINYLCAIYSKKKLKLPEINKKFLFLYMNNFKIIPNRSNKYALEGFVKGIWKMLKKYSKIYTKFRVIRLITFVFYILKHKMVLPEKTIQMVKWNYILRILCRFESAFLKLYHALNLSNLSKVNKRVSEAKTRKRCHNLQVLFSNLLINDLVQLEKYSNFLHQCLCGKIFSTYYKWHQHSVNLTLSSSSQVCVRKDHKLKNSFILKDFNRKTFEIPVDKFVNQNANFFCALKYSILSKSPDSPEPL